MAEAGAFQEATYDSDFDYRPGSPHLAHWRLNERLTSVLRHHISSLPANRLPMTALEIGSGHGGFTEVLLASGVAVTAVEASGPSVEVLRDRFGINPDFTAIYNPDGSLEAVDGTFSLCLCVAVLHHIPDYLRFVDELLGHVVVGGSLVTLQDPLWYPRMNGATHGLDRAGYLVWRLGRGDYRRGAASLSRRLRHQLDESKSGDMVEYHVVRNGVDEQALLDLLTPRFETVELVPYWSNQLKASQRAGEILKLTNTFGILASGRRP